MLLEPSLLIVMSVTLYLYDLSRGLASLYSQALIGTQIDAVWHTSVVYNDTEIYYGQGIFKAVPGTTHLGPPIKTIKMGTSEIPMEVLNDWLLDIAPDWTAQKYNLLQHNCNHFTDALCEFLVGKGIPKYILDIAETVGKTQLGQMFAAMPPPV